MLTIFMVLECVMLRSSRLLACMHSPLRRSMVAKYYDAKSSSSELIRTQSNCTIITTHVLQVQNALDLQNPHSELLRGQKRSAMTTNSSVVILPIVSKVSWCCKATHEMMVSGRWFTASTSVSLSSSEKRSKHQQDLIQDCCLFVHSSWVYKSGSSMSSQAHIAPCVICIGTEYHWNRP